MICASCQGNAPSTATHWPRCGEPLAALPLVVAAQVTAQNMAHRDPQRVRTTPERDSCEQLHTVLYEGRDTSRG